MTNTDDAQNKKRIKKQVKRIKDTGGKALQKPDTKSTKAGIVTINR